MEFTFPWPLSQGEWLAWTSAAVTLALGLFSFLMPRLALRLRRLQTGQDHPGALAEARGPMAGFYMGTGIAALLFAQPLIYLALGLSWLLAAFGRIVSMMSDRGNTPANWAWTIIELVLAVLPLAYAFGFIA